MSVVDNCDWQRLGWESVRWNSNLVTTARCKPYGTTNACINIFSMLYQQSLNTDHLSMSIN